MITIKYNQNIIHIINEDTGDITSCSLNDIITIKYLGPSNIIFPSPTISLSCSNDKIYPIVPTSKIIITLINQDDIVLDIGILNNNINSDIWDNELRTAYNQLMKLWVKAKKGEINGTL